MGPVFIETGGERGIRTLGGSFPPHSLSRRAPSAGSAISPGILFEISSFIQFLRQARVIFLEILYVCLRIKRSLSLNLNRIEYLKQDSIIST